MEGLKQYFYDEDMTATEFGAYWYHTSVLKFLEDMPPADVRPVVLCENCHWFTDTGFENLDPDMSELRMGHCRVLGRDVQACWFCGAGEQKEDEDG